MDGILVVNKPKGLTSHDVVNKIRRIFNTKRVGHTGTLDPLATGVLVICLNNATKLANFLESDNKKYRCTMIFGIETDTYDITGNIVKENYNFSINNDKIDEVFKQFIGKNMQIPPIYSAIKVDGKKLYEYARSGQTVEIKPREIEIYDIYRTKDVYFCENKCYCEFFVHVSKGTYIRSLVKDIGDVLNINTTMVELERVQSGVFKLEDSNKIEEIELGKFSLIKMVDSIEYFKYDVSTNLELLNKIKNGMKLSCKLFEDVKEEIAFIKNDELIAIYKYDEEVYPCYKPIRIWN